MPLDSFTIEILNHKHILHSDRNEKCKLSVERVEEDYFMATCIYGNMYIRRIKLELIENVLMTKNIKNFIDLYLEILYYYK